MKTETYLHVATPCNEDWNKMTAVEKERFCDSCATQVMDFTTMTDQEVLRHLAAGNGSICGRIHKDQLQRALHDSDRKRRKGWQLLMAGVASLFFSVVKGNAQKKVVREEPKSGLLTTNTSSLFTQQMQQAEITLKGKVVNAEQDALLNGYVLNPVSLEKILVNKQGQFVMKASEQLDAVLVGAKGFDSRMVPISFFKNSDTTITLNATDTTITGIGGFDKGDLSGTNIIMGGITSFEKMETKDSVVTFVKKIFNNAFFKILPNPSTKGGVGIAVKQAGTYTVHIFDNNSKLMHVQEITVNAKGEVVQIVFPGCMVKGTYYIRLIDKETKKQYIDKLIVQ
jgi:hypothetical protein